MTSQLRPLTDPSSVVDHVGVSASVIRFWLTSWQRTDEHLPMSHIAGGNAFAVCNEINVESSGGLNLWSCRRGKLVTLWSACASAETGAIALSTSRIKQEPAPSRGRGRVTEAWAYLRLRVLIRKSPTGPQ